MSELELERALQAIAEAPVLLVATDYDGTLAPIVERPEDARPLRECVVALRMLAEMSSTHVAMISGRALRHLAEMTGMPEDVHLVGSHGSEFDAGFAAALDAEARALRDRVRDELAEVAAQHDGFGIEEKPGSVAFHYRRAPQDAARSALELIESRVARIEGVTTRRGKCVVELAVVDTNKGTALETIRQRCGATAVIFLGDDVTDEDAFRTLHGPDLGVKVGDGDSRAAHRVADPHAVARLLARLAELRAAWSAGSAAVPIERHAMLSDQRALALVTPGARICWFCAPRLDAPPLFAELIGGPSAGHFSVRPSDGGAAQGQWYRDDSMTLMTRFDACSVTDLLDLSDGRARRRPGRTDLMRVVEGGGAVDIEFAPRLDFGRAPTALRRRDDGLEIASTQDPIVLHAPGVDWQITAEGPHQTATARVVLDPAHPLVLELRYGTASLRPSGRDWQERVRLTDAHWAAFAARLAPTARHADLVRRSAVVLKALCHGPTGGIAAAATTSLPEHIGGVRNWDYRYCWIRDAAMSAASLVRLGSTQEAMQYLDWLLGVVDECAAPERLQPLYDVAGMHLGTEGEIAELPGYAGSRPVRVGNAASRQVQLDVFGPVVDLVALLLERDAPISNEHWRLVEAMVTAVERRWQEPDHGIWEIRAAPRHHVHSKCMCWLTVTRALDVARGMLERDHPEWRGLADRIRADVLEQGYHPGRRAFTAAYGGDDLDAAALTVGLTGLVSPDDERFAHTVDAIDRELREGATVYRYRADDGLPGTEGGFHVCAGWLVQSYLKLGRRAEAEALLDGMAACAGPTGSMAEQLDPSAGRALGNVPQAYSHLALVDGVLALAAASS